MPYTAAHPITAIVLHRIFYRKLNFTGLLFGSIAPDLENFIYMKPVNTAFGHSLQGLIFLGLPISIGLSFVFHYGAKKGFSAHLPAPLNRYAWHYAQERWKLSTVNDWFVFIASIAIGMLSHLFLDGFTHHDNWISARFFPLVGSIVPNGWPVSRFLQYALSALFMIMEFVYVLWILAGTPLNGKQLQVPYATALRKIQYWLIVTFCMVSVTSVTLLFDHGHHARLLFEKIMVAPVTGAFLGIVLATYLFRVKETIGSS